MIFNEEIAHATAEKLLQIKAIRLSPQTPFTWTSGWKSPIYCDNRKTLSYPAVRDFIKENLAAIVKEKFPEVEAISGVATAGISHGALVADHLHLPFSYVRASAKQHGLRNMIEGVVEEGQKVVVVEDLISTGGSSIEAVKALQEAKTEVLGVMAIFSYAFPKAQQAFEEIKMPVLTLSDYPHLLKTAAGQGAIDPNDQEVLEQWRNNPAEWKP